MILVQSLEALEITHYVRAGEEYRERRLDHAQTRAAGRLHVRVLESQRED